MMQSEITLTRLDSSIGWLVSAQTLRIICDRNSVFMLFFFVLNPFKIISVGVKRVYYSFQIDEQNDEQIAELSNSRLTKFSF